VNKKRRELIKLNEISQMRTYTLGGFEQKVLIEGKKKSNPVVIFLHGGPGAPIPFSAGCRGMFPKMTDQVTMVYWDQLGCGINNHLIEDSFTVDQFVNMTIELIRYVKEEFNESTINIFGVSWGSVLAARVADAAPELIHRILIYGQVLKQLSFNDEVFATLEQSNMPDKYLNRLSEMKKAKSHSLSDLKTIMKWVQKYTQGYQSKEGGKTPMGDILWGLLTSPDYSLRDFKAVVISGYLKNTSLLTQIMTIDLTEILNRISVPYIIFQGDTDIVTSTVMISEFIEASNNQNLILKKVDHSGHFPGASGMEAIIQTGFSFLIDHSKKI